LVNASLNWASIVGIVLAVGGALLYFMRSFKPALARDYDVFFAAIGLLCGGILFFQGWRLDPILQFGQFLLAGTTVFFAYESVRLRGVATEQARRSAYFDDEPAPSRGGPAPGMRGGWDEDYDRFDEPQPIRRRFSGREEGFDDGPQEDLYRPRRTSRAAIPEQAASRRSSNEDQPDKSWDAPEDERSRRMARFRAGEAREERRSDFGDRRSQRDDQRRGSRPGGRGAANGSAAASGERDTTTARPSRPEAEDAAFSSRRAPMSSRAAAGNRSEGSRPEPGRADSGTRPTPRSTRSGAGQRPRDNSSRFDD